MSTSRRTCACRRSRGGTDIISCFALGNPIGPVWRGELQTRGLGLAVQVFDDQGKPVRSEKGELVCTQPFPCMPIYFWNDPGGKKYHAAYFERFDNIWCHGDYVELTAHDGLVIHGRSDSVLNPGGVRIGTAEIYRQVEQAQEVLESVVIGQDWDHDVRVVLFVKLREGLKLDGRAQGPAAEADPPERLAAPCPGGDPAGRRYPAHQERKIVELAVRDVVHGRPIKNAEALANPRSPRALQEPPRADGVVLILRAPPPCALAHGGGRGWGWGHLSQSGGEAARARAPTLPFPIAAQRGRVKERWPVAGPHATLQLRVCKQF
ncbi:MAG: hypothetical protein WDO24_18355 [Pseudomonadota bacterium]